MLRKLAAYRRQNQFDLALQELGRIERKLSCSTGSKARNCADAAKPGSTRSDVNLGGHLVRDAFRRADERP
jgi:hypothetical protein